MIVSFRRKGLRRLFEDDDRSRLSADMVEKIRLILSTPDQAETIGDLDQPAFRLHALKGDLKGFWSITVRANWRIIFRFECDSASEVDLTDFH